MLSDSGVPRTFVGDCSYMTSLYFSKDVGSLSMTANVIGVARSTVSVIVSQVWKALNFYVGPKYISLPKTEEEMGELVAKIESRHGFPQAFGCVCRTHILLV